MTPWFMAGSPTGTRAATTIVAGPATAGWWYGRHTIDRLTRNRLPSPSIRSRDPSRSRTSRCSVQSNARQRDRSNVRRRGRSNNPCSARFSGQRLVPPRPSSGPPPGPRRAPPVVRSQGQEAIRSKDSASVPETRIRKKARRQFPVGGPFHIRIQRIRFLFRRTFRIRREKEEGSGNSPRSLSPVD